MPQTRVLLWTAPRCLSSAFERSIRELSEVKVFYEPHIGAFYYRPKIKTDDVLVSEIQGKDAKQAYDYIDDMLLANYTGFSALFAKNMAYYIPSDRIVNYLEGKFANYKHTFLIRSPRLTAPSLWKSCEKSGISYPGPEGEGFPKLCELFKLVYSTSKEVIVIDSADLLSNPEAIMEQYCKKTGLPYDKKMLTWTPGIVEDWTANKYYKEFHLNAMYSSGFNMGVVKAQSKQDSPSVNSYPPEVEKEIQKDMPYYETMYKYRMVLP